MTLPDTETLITSDGHSIRCRFFLPEAQARGAVLLVPAMGTEQRYYAPLAVWLVAQGFLSVTFDYRGTGLSLSGSLRDVEAEIFDWGLDCAAVIDALGERVGDKPLFWLGHSVGGQLLPFVPNLERLTKVVTVATGSGYWLENALPLRRRVWLLWYIVAPLSVAALGYFPGKRLRMVGNLPKRVMQRWRRWCLHPDYAVGVEGEALRARFAAVRTPIVSLSFSDDEMMSARNTESLHGFYVHAPRTMKRFTPQMLGLKRIGHFGFFRRGQDPLWEQLLLPELTPQGETAVT